MNKDIIQGNWSEVKGKITQQWGRFTDDEITQMKGTFDELAGALQKKYGYQKDEAKRQLESFIERNKWQQH